MKTYRIYLPSHKGIQIAGDNSVVIEAYTKDFEFSEDMDADDIALALSKEDDDDLENILDYLKSLLKKNSNIEFTFKLRRKLTDGL